MERRLKFEVLASVDPDTHLSFRFVQGYGVAMPGALEVLPAKVLSFASCLRFARFMLWALW